MTMQSPRTESELGGPRGDEGEGGEGERGCRGDGGRTRERTLLGSLESWGTCTADLVDGTHYLLIRFSDARFF